MGALKVAPTPQAELAVSAALDANTLRSQLPTFGVQGCQEANFLFLFDRGRTAADIAGTLERYLTENRAALPRDDAAFLVVRLLP